MIPEPRRTPPLLGTLDYLTEVAKDWARERFATAQRGDFALPPHYFELRGDRVRRRRIRSLTPNADSPMVSARGRTRPTAWCHSATVIRLIDTEAGIVPLEQEIVEVLVTDGEDTVAEAAGVARIPGFPPCLGRFRST